MNPFSSQRMAIHVQPGDVLVRDTPRQDMPLLLVWKIEGCATAELVRFWTLDLTSGLVGRVDHSFTFKCMVAEGA